MPTIDAAVMGLEANSYATLADAETYFGTRLYSAKWTGASSTDKEKALLMAARHLDTRVRWKGTKTTYEQTMQWPRYGIEDVYSDELGAYVVLDHETVPEFLKEAQFEQALSLLTEDTTGESDSKGLRSFSVGEISVAFDKGDERSVLSRQVRELIEHYMVSMSGGGFSTVPVVRV